MLIFSRSTQHMPPGSLRHGAFDLGWYAGNQDLGRNLLILADDTPGGYERPLADDSPRQNCGVHPNQRLLFDEAAFQHDRMADGHLSFHYSGVIWTGMDHHVI